MQPVAWRNVGALTTIFTPSPSCRTESLVCGAAFGRVTPCSNEVTLERATRWSESCYPPVPTNVQRYSFYFSPGVCPSGWTKAVHFGSKDVRSLGVGLNGDETIAGCCPTGYDATLTSGSNSIYQVRCSSSLRDAVIAYDCLSTSVCSLTGVKPCGIGGCATNGGPVRRQILNCVPGSYCTTSTLAPTNAFGVTRTALEDAVLIGWHTSDSPGLSAETPSATSTTTTAAPQAAEGLGTGARVGIGIGVAAAVLLVASLLAWWCLRQRRRARPPPKGVEELAADPRMELAGKAVDVKPELPGDALAGTGLDDAAELPAAPASPGLGELPTEREAPGLVELDSTTRDGAAAVQAPGDPSPAPVWPEYQEDRAHRPVAEGTPREEQAETAMEAVEASPAANIAPAVAIPSGFAGADEQAQLEEEEKRIAGRRATLQETIRLLEEDERLKQEQEAVKRRLEELRRKS